jgi:hypothetical protein
MASYVVYEGGEGNGGEGNGGEGGNNGNTCQEWAATNIEHVAAARAYAQTSSGGCGLVITTYYAVGSNDYLGVMGSAITTLHTEDGAKTYRVGSCSASSTGSSSGGCNQ